MSSTAQIGHNRFAPFTPPVNDESKQVIIMPWRKLLECLRMIPAHFLWAQMNNTSPDMNDCCRDPDNLDMEVRKTQDVPMPEPDLYVFRCGCGRLHRRMLAFPGHYGDPAKQPEYKPVNPFFAEKTNATTRQ